MSAEMACHWQVTVNGDQQITVHPGENVEIGRKPLRPLPDDGTRRMEVEDSTKSMSKRHAQFSVRGDGQAILHDLNSTNGTYIIRDNGELMRLPEDDDYILPYSPMRVQFGDVPADFERVDASEPDQSAPVSNLFDYSTPMVTHQEPDAADMSVDQILDLRAGEPTTMFQSQRPKTRNKPVLNGGANEAAAQPVQLVQPVQQPTQPTQPAQPIQPAQFADQPAQQEHVEQPVVQPMLDRQPWQNEQGESSEQSADVMPTPQPSMQPVQRLTQSAEESSEQARLMFPSDDDEQGQPRNLFAGVGENTADVREPRESGMSEQEQSIEPDAVEPANGQQPQQATVQAEPLFAQPEANNDPTVNPTVNPAADQAFMRPQAEPEPETAVFRETRSVVFTPLAQSDGTPQNNGYQPSANYAEPAGGFTPAFEPGSVFDKVSRGEFNKPPEPVIEVDGLTSEDARRTPDMTKQFEMARHAELLPFLAMNPSLYDDLYAWLAAQGNRDIDEALANNPGYQDYRKAVGK